MARTLREWIPRDRVRVRDRGITVRLEELGDDGLAVVDVLTVELVAGVGEEEWLSVVDTIAAGLVLGEEEGIGISDIVQAALGQDEGIRVLDRGRVELIGAIRCRDTVTAKVVPGFDDDGVEVADLVLVAIR
jgi:hypothetical protein